MLRFYDISKSYVDYLRKYDEKVPNMDYEKNNKFVCGIVMQIKEFNYYAPISSFSQKQRTNLLIKNKKGMAIASIRFCFMMPAPDFVLFEKKFKEIDKVDSKYADLLKTEYEYCAKHEEEILKKAQSVYEIGCNKNHPFNSNCCNFKILEQACKSYADFDFEIHKAEDKKIILPLK